MKNDLYNWCSNNGHCIVDKRKEIRKTLDECLLFSKEYEKISRQLHNNSPYLNHTEVDYISTLLSALLFIEDNTSIDDIKQILYYCSEFDMSLISILSKEFIEKLLLAYIDNANNRKKPNRYSNRREIKLPPYFFEYRNGDLRNEKYTSTNENYSKSI